MKIYRFYRDDGEHHLGDVKGMPPIMVGYVAVVLLDAKQPSAEDFVINVESPDQVQIVKHSKASLLISQRGNRDQNVFSNLKCAEIKETSQKKEALITLNTPLTSPHPRD